MLFRWTTLDIFTNRSQHLFNFIPGEWSCPHRRLCKYRRSNSLTDSPAWQLSLTKKKTLLFQITWRSSASVNVAVEPQLGGRFWEHHCLCTLLSGASAGVGRICATRPLLISVSESFVWIERQRQDVFDRQIVFVRRKEPTLLYLYLRVFQGLLGGPEAFPGLVSLLGTSSLLQKYWEHCRNEVLSGSFSTKEKAQHSDSVCKFSLLTG